MHLPQNDDIVAAIGRSVCMYVCTCSKLRRSGTGRRKQPLDYVGLLGELKVVLDIGDNKIFALGIVYTSKYKYMDPSNNLRDSCSHTRKKITKLCR